MSPENWKIVASVTGVFLVIGVGAGSRRMGWLTRQADQSLTRMIAYVLMPAFFLNRVLEGKHIDTLATAWVPPAIGFATTTIGILLAWQFARLIGRFVGLDSDTKQRSFAICTGICNYGYIPIPLAQAFYPDAEVDLILHNLGVDLSLWSIGVILISGGLIEHTEGETPPPQVSLWRRALLNPPLLAVIAGLVIRQSGSSDLIPAPIVSSVATLAVCAIPVGLLVSGAIMIDYMGQADWRGSWRTVLAAISFRQGVMPVLMLTAAAVLPLSETVNQVVLLEAAMPSAVFPIVLVRMYNRDTTTALRSVLSTSLAAIVLIPLWLAAGRWWLGI